MTQNIIQDFVNNKLSNEQFSKLIKKLEPCYFVDPNTKIVRIITGNNKFFSIYEFPLNFHKYHITAHENIKCVDFYKIIKLFMLKSAKCCKWGKTLMMYRDRLVHSGDDKQYRDKYIDKYNKYYDKCIKLYELHNIVKEKIERSVFSSSNILEVKLSNNQIVKFKIKNIDIVEVK